MGANPKIVLVGLDRQEKGQDSLSAKEELEKDFGVIVKSIVNLDSLIQFSKQSADFKTYIDQLEEYRLNWGA